MLASFVLKPDQCFDNDQHYEQQHYDVYMSSVQSRSGYHDPETGLTLKYNGSYFNINS